HPRQSKTSRQMLRALKLYTGSSAGDKRRFFGLRLHLHLFRCGSCHLTLQHRSRLNRTRSLLCRGTDGSPRRRAVDATRSTLWVRGYEAPTPCLSHAPAATSELRPVLGFPQLRRQSLPPLLLRPRGDPLELLDQQCRTVACTC